MKTVQALNLIAGEWREASSGAWGISINPSNGEVLGRYADSSQVDGEAALEAARAAFERPEWSRDPRRRQIVMLRWADRLDTRKTELAHLLTLDNGKVLAQSLGEITSAISEIRYYAGLTRYMPGHVFEVEPGVFSSILKEPAGVAGIIVPWNAPVVLLVRSIAPALAAGCTVVVKPAPQTALITAALIEALHDCESLPAGVVNLVSEAGHDVAALLAQSSQVDVISFTGSNETGQRIMAAAAPSMKKLSLELGGKSSCLVFDDADVDRVAPAIAAAATVISGQQCTAARRVLVHGSCYARMKQALSAALLALPVGPGLERGAMIGPLIDEQAARCVTAQIDAAMEQAQEVLVRGGRAGGVLQGGAFVRPALVAHQDTSAAFIQEEVFGPLLVIERFEDEAEAVARANHSEFGLAASVWTHDGARGLRIARALKNGTVWINDHNKLFAEAETGGYKKSGLGRLHGYDALIDFQETKHIYQNVGLLSQI